MQIDTLADRVWLAYQCLPRDRQGKPPSYRSLEHAYELAPATLSKTVLGERPNHERAVMRKMAQALRVSQPWLEEGKGKGPVVPQGVFLQPRPGYEPLTRYGQVEGWSEAVRQALPWAEQVILPEAFLAGADFPIYRPVQEITPELAFAVSAFAWKMATPAQQIRYSTQAADEASPGGRATPLRRPAVK